MPSLKECYICRIEVEEDEGFYCNDCSEFTCSACGDSDLCLSKVTGNQRLAWIKTVHKGRGNSYIQN